MIFCWAQLQVRSLPCLVIRDSAIIEFCSNHWICQSVGWISFSLYMELSNLIHGYLYVVKHGYLFSSMDFSKLIHGFVLVVTWICQTCYMDLLKLLNGFVKLVTCFSRPLLNKTKLKFKVLKLIDWGF